MAARLLRTGLRQPWWWTANVSSAAACGALSSVLAARQAQSQFLLAGAQTRSAAPSSASLVAIASLGTASAAAMQAASEPLVTKVCIVGSGPAGHTAAICKGGGGVLFSSFLLGGGGGRDKGLTLSHVAPTAPVKIGRAHV
jgi:hypothetical protein